MGLLLDEQPTIGKQLDFHRSPARGRLMLCGNRSGKSQAGAREASWSALGRHPWRKTIKTPNIGWVVTLDRNLHLTVLRPKVLEYIPADLIEKTLDGDVPEIRLKNGSRIYFKSCASGWLKFQAAAVDWIWFDEEVPQKVFRECRIRLIDRRGSWWMSLTPVAGINWIFHDVYQPIVKGTADPGRLALFTWSTYQNTTLSREEIDEVLGDYPEQERQIRIYGRFINRSGLILSELDENIHVVDPEPLREWWPLVTGMDGGTGHPFGAVMCAVDDDGGWYVWNAYRRAKALICDHAAAIAHTYRENAPWTIDEGVWQRVFSEDGHKHAEAGQQLIRNVRWEIDPSAAQSKLEFGPFGIWPNNADRDYDAGVELMQRLLRDRKEGRPGIRFARGRTNPLIEEMRVYSQKPREEGSDAAPRPKKIFDDCLDALRYAAMTRQGPGSPAAIEAEPNTFEYEDALLERMDRVHRFIGNRGRGRAEIESFVARMGRAY